MLPPYVYDLIAAVQQWEDVHGDTSMCFENVLCAVPKEELDRAAAIADYQRRKAQQTAEVERTVDAARELSDGRGPLGPTFDQAVEFNRRYQLGDPSAFGLNPADAMDYGGIGHNSTVFAHGVAIGIHVTESVPAGWMRVHARGGYHDTALPGTPRKAD